MIEEAKLACVANNPWYDSGHIEGQPKCVVRLDISHSASRDAPADLQSSAAGTMNATDSPKYSRDIFGYSTCMIVCAMLSPTIQLALKNDCCIHGVCSSITQLALETDCSIHGVCSPIVHCALENASAYVQCAVLHAKVMAGNAGIRRKVAAGSPAKPSTLSKKRCGGLRP